MPTPPCGSRDGAPAALGRPRCSFNTRIFAWFGFLVFARPLIAGAASTVARDTAESTILGPLLVGIPILIGMASYGARKTHETVPDPAPLRKWEIAATVGIVAFVYLMTFNYTMEYRPNTAFRGDIDSITHGWLVLVLDSIGITSRGILSDLIHAFGITLFVWILPTSILLRVSLQDFSKSKKLSLWEGFSLGIIVALFIFSIGRPIADLVLMSLWNQSEYDIGAGLGLILSGEMALAETPLWAHKLLTLIGTVATVGIGTLPLWYKFDIGDPFKHLRDLGELATKRVPFERSPRKHRPPRQPEPDTITASTSDPLDDSSRDAEIMALRDLTLEEASAIRTHFDAVAVRIEAGLSDGTLLRAAGDIELANKLIQQASVVNRRVRAANASLPALSTNEILSDLRVKEISRSEWRHRIAPVLKELRRNERETERAIAAEQEVLARRPSIETAALALAPLVRQQVGRIVEQIQDLDRRLQAAKTILDERAKEDAITLAEDYIKQRRLPEAREQIDLAEDHPRVHEVLERLTTTEVREAAYARIEGMVDELSDPNPILELLEQQGLLNRERRSVGEILDSVESIRGLLARHVLPSFMPMIRPRCLRNVALSFLRTGPGRSIPVLKDLAALLARDNTLPTDDAEWKTANRVNENIIRMFRDPIISNDDLPAAVVAEIRNGEVRNRLPNLKWCDGDIEKEVSDWLYDQIILIDDIPTLRILEAIKNVRDLITSVVLSTVLPMVTQDDRGELAHLITEGEIQFSVVIELDNKLPDRERRLEISEIYSDEIVSILKSGDYKDANAIEVVLNRVMAAIGWQVLTPDGAAELQAVCQDTQVLIDKALAGFEREQELGVKLALDGFSDFLRSRFGWRKSDGNKKYKRAFRGLEKTAVFANERLTMPKTIALMAQDPEIANELVDWLVLLHDLSTRSGKATDARLFNGITIAMANVETARDGASTASNLT